MSIFIVLNFGNLIFLCFLGEIDSVNLVAYIKQKSPKKYQFWTPIGVKWSFYGIN